MDKSPRVSIIIPVYNGSNYLRDAIDSALAQTYPNIEVIVVNDGSCDEGKTETIALSYGKKIRFLSKENGGVSSALNYGIREMTGEWFAWLSHDDLFSHNRIERDVTIIMSNPDVIITYCNIHYINENREVFRKTCYSMKEISNPRQIFDQGINICSMTIRKTCFEEVGLFDENNRTTQDVLMMLRLSMHFKFFLNPDAIFYSREHPHRDTYRLSKQHDLDFLKISDFIREEMRVEHFFPELHSTDDYDTDAYFWMGSAFDYFQDSADADEYYLKSSLSQKKILKKLKIRVKILRRKFNRLIRPLLCMLQS